MKEKNYLINQQYNQRINHSNQPKDKKPIYTNITLTIKLQTQPHSDISNNPMQLDAIQQSQEFTLYYNHKKYLQFSLCFYCKKLDYLKTDYKTKYTNNTKYAFNIIVFYSYTESLSFNHIPILITLDLIPHLYSYRSTAFPPRIHYIFITTNSRRWIWENIL